jgi:undecaprenyl diphosphate synthase
MHQPTDVKHLAIIMDGNRRWATERGLPKFLGHTEGARNLKKVAEAVSKRGIKFLTLYALSTENLKNRSADELKHLFDLIGQIADNLPDFVKNNARFFVIGNLASIPDDTRTRLESLMTATANHTGLTLTLAINYGGRDEITRAVQKLLQEKIDVTEETITNALDTTGMPDVDLVIRTAGDQRLSNFLPWQTTYAELYFTDVKWPAFSDRDLDAALAWFHEQKRNGGK